MRHTLYVFAFSFLLVVSFACNKNSENVATCDKASSDNVIPIKVDKPFYVEKFSNIFSNVNYVTLEETRNSIIGNISKLEITNDGDFIVFDARAGAVFRFASDGKFLNNIGFRGSGAKEYVFPDDMKYDPFNNKVLVWDNGKSVILTYNIDGRLESKVQLPWVIATFGIIDKEHIICYMNNGEDIRGNNVGNNYKIIKRDGTIIKEFGEYGTNVSKFRPAPDNTFSFQLGRCLCLPPYSTTLYSVGVDSLKAIATFDMLENSIPQEWLYGTSKQLRRKLQIDSQLVYISSVNESDKFYVLRLVRNEFTILCVLRKDTRKVESMSMAMINDVFGMVGNTNLINVNKGKFYFSIDPLDYDRTNTMLNKNPSLIDIKKEMMRQKDIIRTSVASYFGEGGASIYIDSIQGSTIKLKPGERDFINKMSQKSNPIIQICTLK